MRQRRWARASGDRDQSGTTWSEPSPRQRAARGPSASAMVVRATASPSASIASRQTLGAPVRESSWRTMSTRSAPIVPLTPRARDEGTSARRARDGGSSAARRRREDVRGESGRCSAKLPRVHAVFLEEAVERRPADLQLLGRLADVAPVLDERLDQRLVLRLVANLPQRRGGVRCL